MTVTTHLTPPREYNIKDIVRIINPKQCRFYLKNGVYPIDIYTSIDVKTGDDIVVMIFFKHESYPLYQKWCNYATE